MLLVYKTSNLAIASVLSVTSSQVNKNLVVTSSKADLFTLKHRVQLKKKKEKRAAYLEKVIFSFYSHTWDSAYYQSHFLPLWATKYTVKKKKAVLLEKVIFSFKHRPGAGK